MGACLKHHVLLSVAFALVFTGCTPSIKVAHLRPAEINLSSYKKVAIGGIRGDGGEEVALTLETALANCGRFDVVDRQNLHTIMREQNMAVTDSFDPNTTVRLGKLMGTSALIFGRVTRHQYYSKNTSYKTTCVSNGREYPCKGYTTTGYWFMNVQLSVVDVATGKILVTKSYARSPERSVSATGSHPEVNWDPGEEFTAISDEIVQEFMKQIAPWIEHVLVYLYKSSSLPELENGINYARQNDWASAIGQFKTACNTAESNPDVTPRDRARAHYNLGIALGYSGTDYDQSIAEIQKAVSIEPDDTFYSEMSKIRQFKADEARLKQQGVEKGNWQSRMLHIVPIG